jgi:hypothetical protein
VKDLSNPTVAAQISKKVFALIGTIMEARRHGHNRRPPLGAVDKNLIVNMQENFSNLKRIDAKANR